MPYIKNEDRQHVDELIEKLSHEVRLYDEKDKLGVLNYCISRLLSKSLVKPSGWRYYLLNNAIGVLECVKQELYRRVIGPYEDKAIDKNGDIEEYMNQVS